MSLTKTDLYSEGERSASEAAHGGMVEGTKDFVPRRVEKVSGSAACPEIDAEQVLKILGTVAISTNPDAIRVAEALTAQLRESSGGKEVVEITRFRIGNTIYLPYETRID